MSKDRLEAFSDGVFSIVLTLLVLGLVEPQIANHSSFRQYAVAMAPLIPKLISFILSFVMICIHWVNHHYFFTHIDHATVGLVWLNNLFLLWLCILPFPTSLLGNHPTDQFPILVFGTNSLLLALSFLAFRTYAAHSRLFTEDEYAKTQGPSHSLPAVISYAASLLLVFVNVYLALACFFLTPVLYLVPNLMHSK